MAKKIIGIDIGQHSIKAVQITSSWKGPEITGYFLFLRKPFWEEPIPINQEIAAFQKEIPFSGDRYFSGIPSSQALFRNIHLPFTERKKILTAAKYELEELIPFDIEEIQVDYLVRDKDSDGTDLLLIGIKKEILQQHIDLLDQSGIQADAINLDINGLATIFEWMDTYQEGSIALLDLGANKTNLSILRNGRTQLIRSIPIAGNDITKEISRSLNIPMDEAERLKATRVSLVTNRISKNLNEGSLPAKLEKRLSSCVTSLLSQLIKEIDYTFAAYHMQFKEAQIKLVYLCGGTALIPGLDVYIQEEMGIETSLLKPLKYLPNDLLTEGFNNHPQMALATGLALGGFSKKKKDQINFQRDDFRSSTAILGLKGKLIALIVIISCIFWLAIANVNIHLHTKQKKLDLIKSEIRKIFVRAFPEVPTIVDEPLQMSRLIDAKRGESLFTTVIEEKGNMLEVLREISLRMPITLNLRITELEIKEDSIELKGEAESFETVEQAKRHLVQSPLFGELRVRNTRMNPRTRTIEFQLSIKRKID